MLVDVKRIKILEVWCLCVPIPSPYCERSSLWGSDYLGLVLAGADPAELEDMEDMGEMRDYLASLDMLRDRYQLQHAAQGTM